MELFGIWHLDLPVLGFFYHPYLLCLTLILLILAALFPGPLKRLAVWIAAHIWAAAGLDVIFELALITVGAIVALWFGDWQGWVASSRVELVVALVALVLVIAVLRRVVDGWIDGGGGGKQLGVDDNPPGGGDGGVQLTVTVGLQLQLVLLRGPLTPLSSRSALVRAMLHGRAGGTPRQPAPSEDAQHQDLVIHESAGTPTPEVPA